MYELVYGQVYKSSANREQIKSFYRDWHSIPYHGFHKCVRYIVVGIYIFIINQLTDSNERNVQSGMQSMSITSLSQTCQTCSTKLLHIALLILSKKLVFMVGYDLQALPLSFFLSTIFIYLTLIVFKLSDFIYNIHNFDRFLELKALLC